MAALNKVAVMLSDGSKVYDVQVLSDNSDWPVVFKCDDERTADTMIAVLKVIIEQNTNEVVDIN